MAYQAIYRKWRPLVFEDIVGQSHITKTLKNQIMNDKVSHAYLFCGTRGTGKTTAAKILSRAINCQNPKNGTPCNECEICKGILNGSIMDVSEIDAASNTGVDNIRDIKDDISYVASQCKYRVYIIDEVHMLSKGAFNALLKTLEEPPAHVIFILATTEPHKIPETILSRCQRFDFKRITPSDIIVRMKEIATADNINITEDAYSLLANLADGSMRDGLSILERCLTSSEDCVSVESITTILGIAESKLLFDTTNAIIKGQSGSAISAIDILMKEGKDLNTFIDSLISHIRDLMMCKIMQNPEDVVDSSKEMLVKLKSQAESATYEKLSNAVSLLTKAKSDAKWVKNPRTIYELALVKLTRPELDTSTDALLDRLATIEEKAKNASFAPVVQNESAKVEEKPKKKVEVSSRLFAPIDKSKLTAESPIVVTARNWDKIASYIVSRHPFLTGFLTNRKITIDGEGILLLFSADEDTKKKLTAKYIENIQQAFTQYTKTDFKVKLSFEKDVEDVLIDYWNLPSKKSSKTEEKPIQTNTNSNDLLDKLTEDFPEIIQVEANTVQVPDDNTDLHQQELFNEDIEEFLEESEQQSDIDDV